MREIKFRAKRIGNNEWVTGEPHIQCCRPHIHTGEAKTCLIDKETLGQFTGNRDSKGMDIYEGDIIQSVKYPTCRHYIVYDEKEAAFMAVCTESDLDVVCHLTQSWVDEYPKIVVGNVHDNPELLKNTK